MKLILFLLIFFPFLDNSVNAQRVKYYLDLDGNEINKQVREDLLKNHPGIFSSWDYIAKDSGRVSRITNRYYTGILKEKNIKKYIESVTKTTYADSTIFFISYNFIRDLCSTFSDRKISRNSILQRKKFITPRKKFIEKKYNNVVYLEFFESEVVLKNTPQSKKEYFYSDIGGLLKEFIFLKPQNCGAIAIIKPNGQILVNNGESNSTIIAQLLLDKNWRIFFSNPRE